MSADNAEKIAGAILAAHDPMHGQGGGWDLVARDHAKGIADGLRGAAETVAESLGEWLSDSFVSGAELDADGSKANVTDGLFAVARALDRIADVLEKRP